jgi:hypothetical protein
MNTTTTNGNLDSPKMQDLLRKICALKAKADDPSVTEAESLAFAAKVAQLLAQHQLEESHLDVGEKESDPIGHQDFKSNSDDSLSHWSTSPARRLMVFAVCKLYNVKTLRFGAKDWTLIGRKHNIIMAKDMTDYLIKTTLRLSNDWFRMNPYGDKTDFKRGCFKRIAERLHDMWLETAKSEQPVYHGNNPGNLPALYLQEDSKLRMYIDDRWRTRTSRAARIKQGVSAIAGRAAGNTVSLHRQMGSSARSNYMIGKK